MSAAVMQARRPKPQVIFRCPCCGEMKSGQQVKSRKRCIDCTHLLNHLGILKMPDDKLRRSHELAIRRVALLAYVIDQREMVGAP